MKLLTTEEVGKILSFSPKKVRKMITTGELPALKIGTEYRIQEDELNHYLANQVVII